MDVLGNVLGGTRSGSVIVVHAPIDRAAILFLDRPCRHDGDPNSHRHKNTACNLNWLDIISFDRQARLEQRNQGHFGHFTSQMYISVQKGRGKGIIHALLRVPHILPMTMFVFFLLEWQMNSLTREFDV